MTRLIAVDTECTGLDPHHGSKPFIISTCDDHNKVRVWEWPVDPFTRQPEIPLGELEEIGWYLSGTRPIFHHAKFDLRMLSTIGLLLTFPEHIWPGSVSITKWPLCARQITVNCLDYDDTQLASAACCSSDEHDLKSLAFRYLDVRDDDQKALKGAIPNHTTIKKLGWTPGTNPKEERATAYDYWMPKALNPKSTVARKYAIKDVKDRTLPLWMMFDSIMKDDPRLRKAYLDEKALLPILYATEAGGMSLSRKRVRSVSQSIRRPKLKYKTRCRKIGVEILANPDFNPNSDKQLSELLHGYSMRPNGIRHVKRHLHLPVAATTPGGNPSVGAPILGPLLNATFHRRHESERNWLASVYLYSHLQFTKYGTGDNYLSSYAAYALSNTSHGPNWLTIYSNLNQTGTKLTRLSASNPNGQNITDNPRIPLRNVFGPPPGFVWYSIDYSQLELRILAHASKDKKMIEGYRQGIDLHDMVLRDLGWPEHRRRDAKAVNFRIAYGGGGDLIDSLGGPGTYRKYMKNFPGLSAYKDKMISFASHHGFVYTMSGRRLYVEPSRAATTAVNAVVQGTAGEIAKQAMVRINNAKLIDWVSSRMVIQIHDEIIFQFPIKHDTRIIGRICNEMEAAGSDVGVITPVDVKIIKTHWGAKHDVSVPGRPTFCA